jgi:hypothetical protein
MIDDPVVAEVHRIREQILAEYDGDLTALIDDARRRTEDAARTGEIVVVPPLQRSISEPENKKKAG